MSFADIIIDGVTVMMAAPLRRLGANASFALGSLGGVLASAACFGFLALHADASHTAGQMALAILGCVVVGSWGALEFARLARLPASGYVAVPKAEVETVETGGTLTAPVSPKPNQDGSLEALRAGAEFTLLLAIIYACDRTDLIARMPKRQDPQAFWGLWLAICVVACFSLRKVRKSCVLAREQTEEWKGWMQLMFLLYHYFAEAELYNAIRVYIAAYVWMTGYGNWLFYYKTGNFSAVRVAHTLFRLNFFAFFVCVLLRNEFMLYYICPMHTLFTLFVYAALRVGAAYNHTPYVPVLKVACTLALTAVLYDAPRVFALAFGWQPMRSLVAFHDPLHPEFTDELHEWHFRSGLDRYVWVFGMACAAALPLAEKGLEYVDQIENRLGRYCTRGVLLSCALAVGGVWHATCFAKDKYAYNVLHPYTSWVPILLYILLRNFTPLCRSYYFHVFTFLGRVTLETYILQFHVWMKTTGINGSPKWLLKLAPDGWFWTNLLLVSACYFALSVRVFQLTCVLKDHLVPDNNTQLAKGSALAALAGLALFGAGAVLRHVLPE